MDDGNPEWRITKEQLFWKCLQDISFYIMERKRFKNQGWRAWGGGRKGQYKNFWRVRGLPGEWKEIGEEKKFAQSDLDTEERALRWWWRAILLNKWMLIQVSSVNLEEGQEDDPFYNFPLFPQENENYLLDFCFL